MKISQLFPCVFFFEAEFTSNPSGKPEQLPLQLNLPDLAVNEIATTVFYVRSHRTGDRNITLRISYIFESVKSVESVKEDIINIPVTKPFDTLAKFFSNRFEPVTKLYVDEVFVVMPQVKCISPWPIVIENTVIEFVSFTSEYVLQEVDLSILL